MLLWASVRLLGRLPASHLPQLFPCLFHSTVLVTLVSPGPRKGSNGRAAPLRTLPHNLTVPMLLKLPVFHDSFFPTWSGLWVPHVHKDPTSFPVRVCSLPFLRLCAPAIATSLSITTSQYSVYLSSSISNGTSSLKPSKGFPCEFGPSHSHFSVFSPFFVSFPNVK